MAILTAVAKLLEAWQQMMAVGLLSSSFLILDEHLLPLFLQSFHHLCGCVPALNAWWQGFCFPAWTRTTAKSPVSTPASDHPQPMPPYFVPWESHFPRFQFPLLQNEQVISHIPLSLCTIRLSLGLLIYQMGL